MLKSGRKAKLASPSTLACPASENGGELETLSNTRLQSRKGDALGDNLLHRQDEVAYDMVTRTLKHSIETKYCSTGELARMYLSRLRRGSAASATRR